MKSESSAEGVFRERKKTPWARGFFGWYGKELYVVIHS